MGTALDGTNGLACLNLQREADVGVEEGVPGEYALLCQVYPVGLLARPSLCFDVEFEVVRHSNNVHWHTVSLSPSVCVYTPPSRWPFV